MAKMQKIGGIPRAGWWFIVTYSFVSDTHNFLKATTTGHLLFLNALFYLAPSINYA
ncbi:MAG: hypothetical protein KF775_17200 [Cyclobacteriaceae bacterium]|nr:hypothetical protein [Cyclobacteriaceae bacterium]